MQSLSLLVASASASALALGAHAAPLDLVLAGDVVSSIEVNGAAIAGADFIGVSVTGIADDNTLLLLPAGASVPADRTTLFTDLLVSTGAANLNSLSVDFTTAVENIDGFDAVLVDRSPDVRENRVDEFSITINGQTVGFTTPASLTGPNFEYSDFPGNDVISNITPGNPDTVVTDVASLQAAAFNTPFATSSFEFGVFGIDFSDFGVALGDTVTGLTFTNTGALTTDPVFIGGVPVPEPASAALLAAGLGVLTMRRRA